METDLHRRTGHTGAPRLKLDKEVRGRSEKDDVSLYYMLPKRWFLTFMCMNIPIAGWVYPICLVFGKKESQLRDFVKACLIYKLVSLAAALIILEVLACIGLDPADKLLAYTEIL